MHTRLLLIVLCAVVLLSSCGGNVRWMHPDPTPELLIKAMTDLHGFHAYGSLGDEDNSLLSSEEAEKLLADTTLITAETPGFQFVSFSGKTISIMGYNPVYRLPGEDHRSPIIYRYSAELKRARYALPHMAPVSGSLIITSKPTEKLTLYVLPMAHQQMVYPKFNGQMTFESFAGHYYGVRVFSSDKRPHYIF